MLPTEATTNNPMNTPKIRTLDAARTRIAEVEAQLAGKPLPTPVAPVGSATSLKRPAVKPTAAAVKHIVSSNPGIVASMEAIQAELNAAETPKARLSLLERHAEAYRAQARAVKSCSVEQTQLLKVVQRLETRRAYELYADPVAWKNRYRRPPDL
jgi:hypothetical protein